MVRLGKADVVTNSSDCWNKDGFVTDGKTFDEYLVKHIVKGIKVLNDVGKHGGEDFKAILYQFMLLCGEQLPNGLNEFRPLID